MIQEGTTLKNEIREKISTVEQEHGVELSTIQKILLCIKGPITDILDVLYGEMNLFMLTQRFEDADEHAAELLNINEGSPISFRESIVHKNGHPLVYTKSYIPLERCSERVIRDLKGEVMTTGKILDRNDNETVRVVSKISIETPTAIQKELFKTDEPMLSREYQMIHKKQIVIWTKESYPLNYFNE